MEDKPEDESSKKTPPPYSLTDDYWPSLPPPKRSISEPTSQTKTSKTAPNYSTPPTLSTSSGFQMASTSDHRPFPHPASVDYNVNVCSPMSISADGLANMYTNVVIPLSSTPDYRLFPIPSSLGLNVNVCSPMSISADGLPLMRTSLMNPLASTSGYIPFPIRASMDYNVNVCSPMSISADGLPITRTSVMNPLASTSGYIPFPLPASMDYNVNVCSPMSISADGLPITRTSVMNPLASTSGYIPFPLPASMDYNVNVCSPMSISADGLPITRTSVMNPLASTSGYIPFPLPASMDYNVNVCSPMSISADGLPITRTSVMNPLASTSGYIPFPIPASMDYNVNVCSPMSISADGLPITPSSVVNPLASTSGYIPFPLPASMDYNVNVCSPMSISADNLPIMRMNPLASTSGYIPFPIPASMDYNVNVCSPMRTSVVNTLASMPDYRPFPLPPSVPLHVNVTPTINSSLGSTNSTMSTGVVNPLAEPYSPLSPLQGREFGSPKEVIDFMVEYENICTSAPFPNCRPNTLRLYQRGPTPNVVCHPGPGLMPQGHLMTPGPVLPTPFQSNLGMYDNSRRSGTRPSRSRPRSRYVTPPRFFTPQYQPADIRAQRPTNAPQIVAAAQEERVDTCYSMTIKGYAMELPVKPYPGQIYMMNSLLKAHTNCHNCLLESPTGTGKTMSLLAASMSWLLKEKTTTCVVNETEPLETVTFTNSAFASASTTNLKRLSSALADSDDTDDEDDEDSGVFKLPKQRFQKNLNLSRPSAVDISEAGPSGVNISEAGPSAVDISEAGPSYMDISEPGPSSSGQVKVDEKKNSSQYKYTKTWNNSSATTEAAHVEADKPVDKPKNHPKIFYTTRTHKQVEQVVKELKRSPYSGRIKMAILGSREYTCVNPLINKDKDINENCQKCVEAGDCNYYYGSSQLGHNIHDQLAARGLNNIFDIEDIVEVGKRQKICPYYTMRQMVKDADIILCPYSYVMDPQIRESLNINIKGSVLILDEAHNIESVCCETASLRLTQQHLEAAECECQARIFAKDHAKEYTEIRDIVQQLLSWIKNNALFELQNPMPSKFGNLVVTSHPKTGSELVINLARCAITTDTLDNLKAQIKALNDARTSDTALPHNAISSAMKQLCNNIVTTFGYVFQPSNTDKFGYYFTKTECTEVQKNRRNRVWKYNLNVTCLMPSVVFKTLSDARSIVIASGTLSPLSTLKSELGMNFHVTVQGPAVVQPSNLYACQVSCGPTGMEMLGTYQYTTTYEYQDELGRAISKLSSRIPHGILVFISSYTLLKTLRERWMSTDALDLLTKNKAVFFEDKDKASFDQSHKDYASCIQDSTNDPAKKGAIFFGVYRGKLAEGINFSDNYARAVVAVGIPFPSKADTDIELKIEFNNKHKQTLELQHGVGWYRAQAYRALSQAVGRCIRHEHDHGAIILIDTRFTRDMVKKELPKWLSNKIETRYTMNWSRLEVELTHFFHRVSKPRKF